MSLSLKELRARTIKAGQIKNFDKVLSDLKAGFHRDYTDEQACHHAGINPDTYYRWSRESEDFKKEMENAKSFLFRAARLAIADRIIDEKDEKAAEWLLERRERSKYSTRTETTGRDGGPVNVNLSNFDDEELDKLTDEELQRLAAEQARDQATRRGES